MFERDFFLRLLETLPARGTFFGDLFDRSRPLVLGRAPGRLDVMGGVADYSGSLVLELPLDEATWVAVQHNDSDRVRLASLQASPSDVERNAELPLAAFKSGEAAHSRTARGYFQRSGSPTWVAYVAGVLTLLVERYGVELNHGLSLLVHSTVPEGRGVASSAALEVATVSALACSFELALDPIESAFLCQRVENAIVGAPCGVMDQVTAVAGRSSELLAILCQPATIESSLPIPGELRLWGVDSGVRHSVGGSPYVRARVAAFMGYRILAALRGLTVHSVSPNRVAIEDPELDGYLARLTPSRFAQHYRDKLPESLLGRDFIAGYQGLSDPATEVDESVAYPVREATSHPIFEHHRVRCFVDLLSRPETRRRGELLGELMYQSHASYSACGLGSEATDLLVELVKKRGPERGLYGAKITGGGSGGTVAILGHPDADTEVDRIAEEYARSSRREPRVFRGSSPGAAAFGVSRARHDGNSWLLY